MIRFLFFSAFTLFLCYFLNGQSNLYPKISSYKPKDYKANPFIYDIIQSNNGLLYFANQRGLLEYDGERWNLIETDKSSEVNCVDILTDNTILIGTESGFGYLKQNPNGEVYYHDTSSVINDLSESIVQIVSNDKYFLAKSLSSVYAFTHDFKLIFYYTSDELEVGDNLRSLFLLEDGFIFQDPTKGLILFKDNVFKIIKNSQIFNNKIVKSVFKFQNKIFIVTKDAGIFEWKSKETFTNVFYNENFAVNKAINIHDDFLALGTYSKGVFILDESFNITYKLNSDVGLVDNGIRSMYIDDFDQLWVGTTNGISKIDILAQVVAFKSKLKGIVIEDINEFNGELIISTLGGVYRLDDEMNLHKIEGLSSDCFGLSEIIIEGKNYFFIAELYNLYLLNDDFTIRKISQGGPYEVIQSPLNEKHLFVLHYNGIEFLEFQNGAFISKKYIKDFSNGEPFNFIINEKGEIWIGTKPNDGIYMTTISSLLSEAPSFNHFHSKESVPEGPNYLMEYEGQIYTATSKGVYVYKDKRFNYTNRFNFFSDKENRRTVHRMNKTNDGKVWAVVIDEITNTTEIGYSSMDEKGDFKWNSNDFIYYNDQIVHSIFHRSDGTTWLGGSGDGLLKFNTGHSKKINADIQVMIREVNYGDSLVYNGFSELPNQFQIAYNPQLPFSINFGNNFFKNENDVKYSYYLEGFSNDWSSWSDKNQNDFFLSEGKYVFRLKAKNSYGTVSKEVSFVLIVDPPWYRSIWAYISYVLFFAFTIYILIRLSIRRIKNQNIRLEKIIKERTSEVISQKEEAEKQRDIAEEQKKLVQSKNTEILDSINYAQKIQSAILPSDKIITEFFDDFFIFYQPKDIVAGDFYWLHSEKLIDFKKRQDKNKVYLAAADCTGHGVPGALVSVVCNNALNIAVNEFKCTQPAEILNKTRELVISEFGKSNDQIKDGMDISLAKFIQDDDFFVEYSGANNPLWVIRDVNANGPFTTPTDQKDFKIYNLPDTEHIQLLEIRPDKQPIGKFITNQPFKNHRIKVAKGDKIYMFSDGYQDQFGGETNNHPMGKKYKVSNLRKLLLKSFDQNMEQQNHTLKSEFNSWKGELEQVDDVCVIGVCL